MYAGTSFSSSLVTVIYIYTENQFFDHSSFDDPSIHSIHENAHKKNDGSWTIADGPLHDAPSELLFLALKDLHDQRCLHVDLTFTPLLQAKLNDFFFARNEFALSPTAANNSGDSFSFNVVVRNGVYLVGGRAAPRLEMYKGHTYAFFISQEAYLTYPLTVGTQVGSPVPTVTVTDEYLMKKVRVYVCMYVGIDLYVCNMRF